MDRRDRHGLFGVACDSCSIMYQDALVLIRLDGRAHGFFCVFGRSGPRCCAVFSRNGYCEPARAYKWHNKTLNRITLYCLGGTNLNNDISHGTCACSHNLRQSRPLTTAQCAHFTDAHADMPPPPTKCCFAVTTAATSRGGLIRRTAEKPVQFMLAAFTRNHRRRRPSSNTTHTKKCRYILL